MTALTFDFDADSVLREEGPCHFIDVGFLDCLAQGLAALTMPIVEQ